MSITLAAGPQMPSPWRRVYRGRVGHASRMKCSFRDQCGRGKVEEGVLGKVESKWGRAQWPCSLFPLDGIRAIILPPEKKNQA